MNQTLRKTNSDNKNQSLKHIISDLQDLQNKYVEVNGIKYRPSQCYSISWDPFHIFYNTNCPDSLKQKIENILAKWQSKVSISN
jgi:hypothetical protein